MGLDQQSRDGVWRGTGEVVMPRTGRMKEEIDVASFGTLGFIRDRGARGSRCCMGSWCCADGAGRHPINAMERFQETG